MNKYEEKFFEILKNFKNLESLKTNSEIINNDLFINSFYNLKKFKFKKVNENQNQKLSLITLLKQNRNLIELEIYFYNRDLFDYIAYHQFIEKLEITEKLAKNDLIYFSNALEKNQTLKILRLHTFEIFPNELVHFLSFNTKIIELSVFTKCLKEMTQILQLNTNLKRVNIILFLNKNEIIIQNITDIFLYNYTLNYFQLEDIFSSDKLNLSQIINPYIKRNKIVMNIQKYNFQRNFDLSFKFK